jgi:hypothetical protein
LSQQALAVLVTQLKILNRVAMLTPIGCVCPFPIAPVVQSESEGGLALADHKEDFWAGKVDAFWLCFGDQYCGPGEFGVCCLSEHRPTARSSSLSSSFCAGVCLFCLEMVYKN